MVCLSLFTQVIGATGLLAQHVLGIPSAFVHNVPRADEQLLSFIAKERPVALKGILDNIGGGGSKVAGAASGLVIASPSKADPDYFFTWTRDSALTLKVLIDTFIDGDRSLQPQIQNYVASQARLQTVSNPSGSLTNGAGLGEPKFEANGTAFNGAWGRPQRDGPALRATALITYSQWLIANGQKSTAISDVWPIVRNDLAYVGQYWNQTGFDLWEEVEGSSFFTIAVQHRALVEGGILASQIGEQCRACATQAPQILCFLQSFWNGNYILANINENNGRTAIDANTLLGSIHIFNPNATCDDADFQPCSARALANHKVVTDSFRTIYGINSGIPAGSAVAVGRYSEDVYQGGHPWYLCTLAAAEQLYDALYQWDQTNAITITSTSLPFFQDFSTDIQPGTYESSSPTYQHLTSSIRAYADEYLSLTQQYTPESGALAEQFNCNTGIPLSAIDLTWSYASFLTATNRQAGKVPPPPWAGAPPSTPPLPLSCAPTSERGTYTPSPNQPPCSTPLPPTLSITFNLLKPTTFGQNIFLTGSIPELRSWNINNAIPLSANTYTGANPRWFVTVGIPAGAGEGRFRYKYLLKEEDGTVRWEGGGDRGFDVGREANGEGVSCDGAVSLNDEWRG